MFDTKHPHAGFAAHRQESLKGQGRSLRMPEGFALGSYSNYNYAAAMKDCQNWHQHRDCFRQDIELIDLQQSFDTFLSVASVLDPALSAIHTGKIFPIVPQFYWKEEEHADPVKQVKAWETLMRLGILSHSDVMMRVGKDPERQKLEVKADKDEMKEYTIYDTGQTLLQMEYEEGNDE